MNSSKSNLKPLAEMRIKHRLSKTGIQFILESKTKSWGLLLYILQNELAPSHLSQTQTAALPVIIAQKTIKFTSYCGTTTIQQHHRSTSQASACLPVRRSFQHGWENLTNMISAEGICLISIKSQPPLLFKQVPPCQCHIITTRSGLVLKLQSPKAAAGSYLQLSQLFGHALAAQEKISSIERLEYRKQSGISQVSSPQLIGAGGGNGLVQRERDGMTDCIHATERC